MKRKLLLILMLATVVIPAGILLAQEDDPPPPPPLDRGQFHDQGQRPGPPHSPPPPPGPKFMLEMFERVTRNLPQKLDLTAEQKEKFTALVKQNRNELKEIIKKLEQQREKFDKDLNALLTAPQQEKLKELKKNREQFLNRMRQGRPGQGMGPGPGGQGRGQRILKAIEELNLPDEKQAQVKKIIIEHHEKAQKIEGDPQARRQLMQDMMQKIREVLTPEQMQQLREEMRPEGGPGFRGPRQGRFGQGGPGPHGPRQGPDGPPPPREDGEQGPPPPPQDQQQDSLW